MRVNVNHVTNESRMVGKFLDEDALNGVGAASAALTTLEGSVEETEEGLSD